MDLVGAFPKPQARPAMLSVASRHDSPRRSERAPGFVVDVPATLRACFPASVELAADLRRLCLGNGYGLKRALDVLGASVALLAALPVLLLAALATRLTSRGSSCAPWSTAPNISATPWRLATTCPAA